MAKARLRSMRRVSTGVSIDSIEEEKKLGNGRAFRVLMEAQRAWDKMSRFRKERERNKRYTYGKQWDDIVTVDGKEMREEEYILKQGNIPLKNNIIRKIVRTVLGVYRSQMKEPTCTARDRDEQRLGETMSTILQCNMQLNRMQEVLARTLEEFLISGLAVHRKWYGWRDGKCDCWTDKVQNNCVFMDSAMRDERGWDVSLIGEVHDVSFETLCSQFANSPEEFARLRDIYKMSHDRRLLADAAEEFGYSRTANYDFLYTSDYTRCRVIEVWRKESKPRYRCHDYNSGELFKIEVSDYAEKVEAENSRRLEQGLAAGMDKDDIPFIRAEWFMDDYWYFYYLSPFGHILREGESPYAHGSHPYVFKAYPFIDGEIHSFVGDFIDQQRYINRLITLHDWIMRASAKGLLLVPEDCIPQGMDISDIADEWARFNGVILIRKGAQQLPQQIANNATHIGTSELLNLQLRLIEDISGVNGSLQGKPGYSGMSASLYSQQTQNATMTLLDILETFSSFVVDGAYKDVKNMQQYYDDKRMFNIVGKRAQYIEYDPEKFSDVEFDLSIVESTQTPAYRMLSNEFLMEIWRSGQISIEQLLEHGNFPFADELLQSIQAQKEQVEQGQTPNGLSPELLQKVQKGANMNAVQQIEKGLRAA